MVQRKILTAKVVQKIMKGAIERDTNENDDKAKREINVIIHRIPESEKETAREEAKKDLCFFNILNSEVLKLWDVGALKTIRLGNKINSGRSKVDNGGQSNNYKGE